MTAAGRPAAGSRAGLRRAASGGLVHHILVPPSCVREQLVITTACRVEIVELGGSDRPGRVVVEVAAVRLDAAPGSDAHRTLGAHQVGQRGRRSVRGRGQLPHAPIDEIRHQPRPGRASRQRPGHRARDRAITVEVCRNPSSRRWILGTGWRILPSHGSALRCTWRTLTSHGRHVSLRRHPRPLHQHCHRHHHSHMGRSAADDAHPHARWADLAPGIGGARWIRWTRGVSRSATTPPRRSGPAGIIGGRLPLDLHVRQPCGGHLGTAWVRRTGLGGRSDSPRPDGHRPHQRQRVGPQLVHRPDIAARLRRSRRRVQCAIQLRGLDRGQHRVQPGHPVR